MARRLKTIVPRGKRLRSQLWFDNPDNPGMTALYIERYLNYGLTSAELRSGRPIIGIAQTGSDLSPCNRHHLELAARVRAGIRDAGGIAFEFPCHPMVQPPACAPIWSALGPATITDSELSRGRAFPSFLSNTRDFWTASLASS